MAAPIFTWLPDSGSQEDNEFDVTEIKFGEGYEIRISNQINDEKIEWPLEFSGSHLVLAPIRDFIKARKGVEAFEWTNPFGELGLYKAKKYAYKRMKDAPSLGTISVTFTRVYEPTV